MKSFLWKANGIASWSCRNIQMMAYKFTAKTVASTLSARRTEQNNETNLLGRSGSEYRTAKQSRGAVGFGGEDETDTVF